MSPSLQGGSAGPPHLFLPADHPSEEMADSILNLCLGSQSRILGGLLSRLDPDGLISVEVRSVARGFTSPSARPGVRRYSQTASPRRCIPGAVRTRFKPTLPEWSARQQPAPTVQAPPWPRPPAIASEGSEPPGTANEPQKGRASTSSAGTYNVLKCYSWSVCRTNNSFLG